MAGPTVAPAAPAKPTEYWKDTSLSLGKGSIDNKYAQKKKRTANVPHNYVSDLQKDLIELGYLNTGDDDGSFGTGTERAVKRFQRHAKRPYRMLGKAKVAVAAWTGSVTGGCDHQTAREVRDWLGKKYRLPLGIHTIVKISGGKLRDDVAKLWKKVVDAVAKKGGTLLPPDKEEKDYYSDTWRNPTNGFKSTGGNSKLSLHYTGRAIDLSMEPAGGKGQRWWIVKESNNNKTYWRLYCKTDKQDGTQGENIAAKSKKYYEFWQSKGETWMPGGYYLDLTKILADNDFERIPAQSGWESTAKKREWWHFYYAKGIQDTFLDEMEMIGYTEAQLNKAGWTDKDLDKHPG